MATKYETVADIIADRDALRKDAERWRWWRQRWTALCGYACARSAGLDLRNVYVTSAEQMDAVTDDAIKRARKGAA